MITINGKNIATEWKLILVKDGFYNELMKFPDIKERLTIDWSDNNGLDVNLSDPLYKDRTLTFQFFCDTYTNYRNFIAYLKANQVLNFFDTLTDKTYVFEYQSCTSFSYYVNYNLFAISVRENNPTVNPISYLMTTTGLYLLTTTGLKIQL